jgi:hypothetical protein
MAAIYDFNITQGSQFDVRLTVNDENGTALNLNGYSARGYLKHRYSDTGNLLDLSPTIVSGDAGVSYVSGLIDVSLLASQTSSLPVVQGVYDIEIYTAGTYADKVIKGMANVHPEVTD